VAALDSGSTGPAMVRDYRRRIEESFVLADHKRLRRVPEMLLSDDVQFRYPRVICDLVESVYRGTLRAPRVG